MSLTSPKVSIIIATYCSGVGLERVMGSLDRQTLPQDQFEVVFVDDGSPDDTFEKVQALAQERDNVQAFRIDNSGWPSKPRNVGIEHARGEYLMFMDHDDSLYPDGLRRAYEFARETNADLMSPKESKTNDRWWGLANMTDGNLRNVRGGESGLARISPLVPHKLYRRSMFMDHDIRFPEGSRVLWEDQYINVDAFRHASVVSVLTDYPMYLWHASDTNSSHTFHPSREDFWDRLDDLLEHVDAVLDRPEDAADRDQLLAAHVRTRVIDRVVRQLVRVDDADDGAPNENVAMSVPRAQRALERYGTEPVLRYLPRKHRMQARFLERGRTDLLVGMHRFDGSAELEVRTTHLNWSGSTLRAGARLAWRARDPQTSLLRSEGGRIVLNPPAPLDAEIPSDLLDVTDELSRTEILIALSGRRTKITWLVPFETVSMAYVERDDQIWLEAELEMAIDLETVGGGRALPDDTWDLLGRIDWGGMIRSRPVQLRRGALAAVVAGRPTVVYANASGGLSLDLGGRQRTMLTDAMPETGPAGTVKKVRVELTQLHGDRPVDLPLDGLFVIDAASEAGKRSKMSAAEAAQAGVALEGRIKVDRRGARFEGRLPVGAPAVYRVFSVRGEEVFPTRNIVIVGRDGSVAWGQL